MGTHTAKRGRVDKYTFAAVKRGFIWLRDPKKIAKKYRISEKTAIQIKHSKTLADYKEQMRYQHPEQTEPTLADIIKKAHRVAFTEAQVAKQGAYVEPTAKIAALELLEWHTAFGEWKQSGEK